MSGHSTGKSDHTKMGPSLLSASVFLLVLNMTRADSTDGFSIQYFFESMGPYDIKIEDADLMRSFEDMCDARTLVHNRTFHETGKTLSFKTKRIIDDNTIYYNMYSCQFKETYTLSCRRMDRPTCYATQQYFEFRSVHQTPANCQCIGICFDPNLVSMPANEYFFEQDPAFSKCEFRLPSVTSEPRPRDDDFGMDPHGEDFGRAEHRVDFRVLVSVGAVLGGVVLCLLVVVIILIVSLRRVMRRQNGKPQTVPYVMFPDTEKKPISTMEYPPKYADAVKTAP